MSQDLDLRSHVAYEITNVYTMKMAGVFMISTSALPLRTGPSWSATRSRSNSPRSVPARRRADAVLTINYKE
jgi:hypothetical protein